MRFLWVLLFIAASITAASGQGKTQYETTLTHTIEGVDVAFPLTLAVAKTGDGQPVAMTATVDLSDFVSKVDQVINAAWASRKLDFNGRLRHNGTLLTVEATALRVKVHFRAQPGLVPSSSGSVVAYFQPHVLDGSIRLSGNVTEFNISNDLTRAAVRAFSIDGRVRDEIGDLLTRTLSAPDAGFALPPAAQALGVKPGAARFGMSDGKPVAIIDGSLPALAATLLQL